MEDSLENLIALRSAICDENYSAVANYLSRFSSRNELVQNILKKAPKSNDTCIHMAARGRTEILKLFLNALASEEYDYVMRVPNKYGETVYHLATASGNLQTVKLLVAYTPQQLLPEVFFIQSNYHSASPLWRSVMRGSIDIVSYILSIAPQTLWGPDLKRIDPQDGLNVLQKTFYHCGDADFFQSFFTKLEPPMIKALLEHFTTSNSSTLQIAAYSKHTNLELLKTIYGYLEMFSSNPSYYVMVPDAYEHNVLMSLLRNESISRSQAGYDAFQFLWSKTSTEYRRQIYLPSAANNCVWQQLPSCGSFSIAYFTLMTQDLQSEEIIHAILIQRIHKENLVAQTAIRTDNISFLRYLLNRLGTQDRIVSAITARNKWNQNVLFSTLSRKDFKEEEVDILLNAIESPESRDMLIMDIGGPNGDTSLHEAIFQNYPLHTIVTIMNSMTRNGQRTILSMKTFFGSNPIYQAKRKNRPDIVKLLSGLQ